MFYALIGLIISLHYIDKDRKHTKNYALAVNENKTKQMRNYGIAINFTYEWMGEQTKDCCFPITTVYTYNNKKKKTSIDGLI